MVYIKLVIEHEKFNNHQFKTEGEEAKRELEYYNSITTLVKKIEKQTKIQSLDQKDKLIILQILK